MFLNLLNTSRTRQKKTHAKKFYTELQLDLPQMHIGYDLEDYEIIRVIYHNEKQKKV